MKKIGKLFIALGIIAVLVGCKKTTDEIVELTKIEITSQADKVEFFAGDELDTTGLEVTAFYSDGSKSKVENWTATGYDSSVIGEQTITVSYTEDDVTQTTSYKITVKALTLDKIEITAQAEKTEYYVGDVFDTTGLKVTATFSNGTTEDVTSKITISGFDSSAAVETQTITVTYGGKSATFTVKIIGVKEIKITKEPAKKDYYTGDNLDTTGLKVTATFSNGTTEDVTSKITTSGFDSSAAVETQTITVTYGGKSATFTVKIIGVKEIKITKEPAKKDYHIGDEIDLTGMVVTANYNDGSTKTLESTEYTVSGFDSTDLVNEQLITVTHNDKTDTFKIRVLFSWLETPVQLPAGTNGTYGTEGTYVLFGVWPQDVVPVADVETLGLETSTDKVTRGYMEYVKGSDGNYYVKCTENALLFGYQYKKDGTAVGQDGIKSRWFKVMPIKWRVFDEAYDVDGNSGTSTGKLLVAENILTANVPYYEDKDNNRKIDNKTVYLNNYMHSQIRAYLNGYKYTGYDTTSSSNVEKAQWNNKGFLQTAFTSDAIDSIITTKVDNSKEQMSYDGTNGMDEKYACDPKDDKIFLLSEKEVVQYSKSGEEYKSYGEGNSRIRVTTDFAKANFAFQNTTIGHGGYWWLRSPYYGYSYCARGVYSDGYAYLNDLDVIDTYIGVVPALSISF